MLLSYRYVSYQCEQSMLSKKIKNGLLYIRYRIHFYSTFKEMEVLHCGLRWRPEANSS
jgi:hypothetical protein